MISNKLKEEVILYRSCKDNTTTDEGAFLDLECLQDMLTIQTMHSLFNNISRTKTGRIRKDSRLTDVLETRLNQLVSECKEFEIAI
ncbi:MAG: hypothetical protein KIT33_15140 [Candidatus Kapabacteria bacterium]|nr:hypothetical protein [Ignavibacteriota bacterium]MCW5886304.1 hypothetical protein [Candidatus Kapabacteria bacterium]